ncbi:DUF4258 domain-containing protein [Candidatus Methylospira mobilis]|uniref:DUF4258 domain-containing protein n=1 Tax=Candidatus Methylospira mobilis TaxID=1808979 RepID=UPI00387EBFFC
MNCSEVRFSAHAVTRAFQRGLSEEEIFQVITDGEMIADYPDDTPYPSRLILGYAHARPIHVVPAQEPNSRVCFVVTAYQPDSNLWSETFRNRRN